jgi:hypothetical protein
MRNSMRGICWLEMVNRNNGVLYKIQKKRNYLKRSHLLFFMHLSYFFMIF